MHYLGHNGADRLNLRIARAKRDPPDDIIEQMRNEAQFLNDRAVDQRNVADAAEPLFASLDDKQKTIFIQEMVNLSHERGLDYAANSTRFCHNALGHCRPIGARPAPLHERGARANSRAQGPGVG